jgi:hypothetical protein
MNARSRRIITGSEVILTPESVEALRGTGSADMLGPHPYRFTESITKTTISRGAPFLHASTIRPVFAEDLSLGGDPWLLGGCDPFSLLPATDGEPIPKRFLICYCNADSASPIPVR